MKDTKKTAESSAPEGWVKLSTNRPVYQGERGKGDVVQGFVLGLLDMPPAKGKPWQAFVIKLTQPCRVVTRDGEVMTAPPETEILVPANHQLQQHLKRAAENPSLAFEVRIQPTGQVKTNAGAMTTFDIHVNPQPITRDGASRVLAMQTARSLPEHATG
jgi:hypothetical protein